MRNFVLSASIIATLFVVGTASAQDRGTALEFIHEPQGQVFTPPPLRIVRIDPTEQRTATRAVVTRMHTCMLTTFNPAGSMYAPYTCALTMGTRNPAIDLAKQICADRVEDIYTFRDRIYTACLNEELEPLGYRTLDPSNANEVAAYYDVSTD